MTLEELAAKYDGARVSEDRANTIFRPMGKFGQIFVHLFSFDTDNATEHFTRIVPQFAELFDGPEDVKLYTVNI